MFGHIYVADSFGIIRTITPAGVVSTLAGSLGTGSADGLGANAKFAYPRGIAVDGTGRIFVADSDNSTIRMISSEGMVSTFAGLVRAQGDSDGPGASARFNGPFAVAVDRADNIFVSDTRNHTIRRVSSGAMVTPSNYLVPPIGAITGSG